MFQFERLSQRLALRLSEIFTIIVKNSRNCEHLITKPHMECRIHWNTYFNHLWRFYDKRCDLGRWARRSKTKKIDTGVEHFTYIGTRPLWTDNSQIWHEGSCVGHSHWWHILPKSVKGFRNCGGLKMVVFHWLEALPLQQVSTTVLPVMLPKF